MDFTVSKGFAERAAVADLGLSFIGFKTVPSFEISCHFLEKPVLVDDAEPGILDGDSVADCQYHGFVAGLFLLDGGLGRQQLPDMEANQQVEAERCQGNIGKTLGNFQLQYVCGAVEKVDEDGVGK